MNETTTWTTSVCVGALILVAAGLLNGVQATTYWNFLDALKEFGAEPVSRRVVQAGKIVTAAERVLAAQRRLVEIYAQASE